MYCLLRFGAQTLLICCGTEPFTTDLWLSDNLLLICYRDDRQTLQAKPTHLFKSIIEVMMSISRAGDEALHRRSRYSQ